MELPAFQILKCLSKSRSPVSLSTLRDETGIAPATLNRLLAKMTDSDYVRRVDRGLYTGGPAFMVLATLAMENLQTVPFRPLLHQMAMATGQNAELYAITTSGPVFLMSDPGHCHFRTNLPSGHIVRDRFQHAAAPFRFARFPDAYEWEKVQMELKGIDPEVWREQVETAKRRKFSIERGKIKPELARFAAPLEGADFCVVVSGLITDFPEENDEKLRRTMLRVVREFEKQA